VERAKIVVEGIVEEGIVDRKVEGLLVGRGGGLESPLRALAWRARRRIGVGEERVRIGGFDVGREVETVCDGQRRNARNSSRLGVLE
jgi:hypothetical protein